MVPGANCFQRAGGTSEPSPEPAPGLPHFGVGPQADLTPFTLASPLEAHPQGAGGGPTNTNVPNNSMYNCAFPEGQLASPGQVGEVHQLRLCGCKCELCDTPCVLQRGFFFSVAFVTCIRYHGNRNGHSTSLGERQKGVTESHKQTKVSFHIVK